MYYYKHINGTIHKKPDIVVDMGGGPNSYFKSPFVQRWWYEDNNNENQLHERPPSGVQTS